MTTISLGLRTVSRSVDYFGDTVRRLLETGVLAQPEVLGFHVAHFEELTPNGNAVRALRAAAGDRATWVLFLEDDIDFVNDLIGSTLRWLARFERPGVRFHPLGCFYPDQVAKAVEAGAYELPLNDYYGSQAVLLRSRDAADFADYLAESPHRAEFDLHLARWHREREPGTKTVPTPAPCLVEHLGEISTLGPWGRTGRIAAFGGREHSFSG